MFNDDTHPSGHISRPNYVLPMTYLKPSDVYTSRGIKQSNMPKKKQPQRKQPQRKRARPVWLRDESSDISSDDDASSAPATTTTEPDQPTGDNPVRPAGDPDPSPTLAALIQSQQSMATQIQALTATVTQLVAQRNLPDPPAAANKVSTAPVADISNPAGDDPVRNPVPGPSSTADPQSVASVLNSGSADVGRGHPTPPPPTPLVGGMNTVYNVEGGETRVGAGHAGLPPLVSSATVGTGETRVGAGRTGLSTFANTMTAGSGMTHVGAGHMDLTPPAPSTSMGVGPIVGHGHLQGAATDNRQNGVVCVGAGHTDLPPAAVGESAPLRVTVGLATHMPMYSAGTPIGTTVKHATKLKIWEHKFVDLRELLYPNNQSGFTLAFHNEDNPELNLEPRNGKQLSETEWGEAFDIFLAVYVQRYPEQLNDLLSYARHVKELMRCGANWAFYDLHYRCDREFSHCSWLVVRQDLELKAYRLTMNTPFRGAGGKRGGKSPRGYCFKYHSSNAYCSQTECRFKHVCPKCQRSHPLYLRCHTQPNPNPKPQKQSQATKPANPNPGRGTQ